MVTEDVENCEFPKLPIMTSENSCIQAENTCSIDDIKSGIIVNVKVNNEHTEDFYVLADDGNKVTLILNRNLGDNVAWYADAEDNSYGPITALIYLQSQTSTWTNLPEMTLNTFEYDNGSEDVTLGNNNSFTMYARLPKHSEIHAISNSGDITNIPWLYINLKNTGDDSTRGYWTSTAESSDSYFARNVSHIGYVDCSTVIGASSNGLRPVIELSK